MPPLRTKERNKQGLLMPLALGGLVLAAVGGVFWWRNRARAEPGPGPGAVLVASTAPGQPEIS